MEVLEVDVVPEDEVLETMGTPVEVLLSGDEEELPVLPVVLVAIGIALPLPEVVPPAVVTLPVLGIKVPPSGFCDPVCPIYPPSLPEG